MFSSIQNTEFIVLIYGLLRLFCFLLAFWGQNPNDNILPKKCIVFSSIMQKD